MNISRNNNPYASPRRKKPRKPPTPQFSAIEFAAIERFFEGKASGDDFKVVAKFLKISGMLPASAATKSTADLAKLLQSADRAVSEGLIRFDGGRI